MVYIYMYSQVESLLFCQPRVEVTSCFVYKVMGLTFYDRINTQLIYRFELAQVVARRITKPQRFESGCSFFYSDFFYFFFGGGGGGEGSDFIILFMSFFLFIYLLLFFFIFYPFNMYKTHI